MDHVAAEGSSNSGSHERSSSEVKQTARGLDGKRARCEGFGDGALAGLVRASITVECGSNANADHGGGVVRGLEQESRRMGLVL